MAYLDDLRFLMSGLQARAIDPDTAITSLMGLKAEKRDRNQARRAAAEEAQQGALEAQQGQLESLASTALSAAGQPTDLAGVLKVAKANAAFSSGNPQLGLESLFLPKDGPNQGLSRINPTLPSSATSEIGPKVALVLQEGITDPGEITELIGESLGYGPKTLARLAPEIQKLIVDAIKRYRSGY